MSSNYEPPHRSNPVQNQPSADAASLEMLKAEHDHSPASADVLLRLADIYMSSSRFDAEAKRVYDAAALIDPQKYASLAETAGLIHKVELLVSQRRQNPEEVEDLRRMVSQLVDQYPESPDLRKVLGDCRVLAGRPGFAIEQYRRALDLGYERPEDLFDAFERKKDELAPDPVALDFFSELTATLKGLSRPAPSGRRVDASTPTSELGALSEEAIEQIVQEHLQQGHPNEAIALLERLCLLESSPKYAHKIARILLDDGRPWEAFLRLKEIPMDQTSKQLMNETASWLEKDDQYDQAVEVLRHVNDNDLVVLEASFIYEQQIEMSSTLELADLHYKSGRKIEALHQYVGLIRNGMTDVSEFVGRLELIIDGDEIIPAKEVLYLAEFFRDRGERQRAVHFLNRLFQWHPEPGEFEWQRISGVVESILAAEPTQPQLCLGLGRLCLRLGKMDRAIQEFILATADPDLQQAANRALAESYALTGQYSLSLEKYRNVKLTAEDIQAIYKMIDPLEKSGADSDVIQALRLISEVDPAYMDVAQRIAKGERQSSPSISLPSADPKMRALIGDLAIGRYRYVDKIGTGGMGVVYKVFDIKHNCIVAMKILRESLANSPKALTRFIREAQYVDQLNHPNIVHIFDFNISKIPGQSFIAMEYVDGPSMRQLLDDTFKDNRSIDITYVQKVLNYSAQICDALASAHNEGIVHRDIKPDNVMSTKRGIVKITDFGILHHEEMNYTPTVAIIGTPRYMSPEQVQGGHIDGRSDIYAVGILLYEMLTSAPPFISGDIAFQQVNNTPQSPRAICPLINASLESVILSCLEKDADKRYQSAKILQEALLTELQEIGGTPPPSRNATGHRSTAELNRMTPFARPAVDANLEEDLDLD